MRGLEGEGGWRVRGFEGEGLEGDVVGGCGGWRVRDVAL